MFNAPGAAGIAATSAPSRPLAPAPRRRFAMIYNPIAGGSRPRRIAALVQALTDGMGAELTIRATDSAGHATRLAADLRPDDADALIVASGDGVINEAINGLIGPDGRPGAWAAAGRPFGVAPLGTANVLAAELGAPTRPADVAAALVHAPVRNIHLGLANGRAFSMMAGVGLDAHVVERVDRRLKRWTGKGAYVVETLAQLLADRGRRYRVEIDGVMHEAASVIIANGHYYGGRFVCAPAASLFSPSLHVCLFPHVGRWHALRYLWGVTAGRLKYFRDYHVTPATAVTVYGPDADSVQGDGDIIARLPLAATVAPWTLPVIAPGAAL